MCLIIHLQRIFRPIQSRRRVSKTVRKVSSNLAMFAEGAAASFLVATPPARAVVSRP